MPKPESQHEPITNPTAWFAALEAALRRGDLQHARDAQQQLHDLGVDVKFRRGAIRIGHLASEDTTSHERRTTKR